MATNQERYAELCDNDNRQILEQLAEDSNDPEISNIIRCYSVGLVDREIRKKMDKFLLPAIKKAATFLQLTVEGKVKSDIITAIIIRIESLLKDLCAVCGDYFNVKLSETPLFRCLICQQGCHDPCFEQMNTVLADVSAELRSSFQFICTRCHSTFSTDNGTPPKAAKAITEKQDEAEVPIVDNPPQHTPDQNQQSQDHNDASQDIRVCKKYRRRECPHGASGKTLIDGNPCAFSHPRRCRRYCHNGTHPKYGCTKTNCEYLHPMLCKYSVRNRVCTNLDCRYTHLKFTRRYDAIPASEFTQQSTYRPTQQNNSQQYQHQSNTNQVYANTRQQAQSAPPTANTQQPDMRFLLEMIQKVQSDFSKQLQEINAKLDPKPTPPIQMPPQMQPTYIPQQNQAQQNVGMQMHQQPLPMHPHC